MRRAIFISYRRDDEPAWARLLHLGLTPEFGGDQVYIDVEGLEYGADFVAALDEQLQHCLVMLAVIGPKWLGLRAGDAPPRLHDDNDFVRTEVRTALERGIRVVPVLVNGALMPRKADLPEDLHALVRRQAMELDVRRFEPEVGRLAVVLRKVLADAARAAEAAKGAQGAQPAPVPPAAPAAPAAPQPQAAAQQFVGQPEPAPPPAAAVTPPPAAAHASPPVTQAPPPSAAAAAPPPVSATPPPPVEAPAPRPRPAPERFPGRPVDARPAAVGPSPPAAAPAPARPRVPGAGDAAPAAPGSSAHWMTQVRQKPGPWVVAGAAVLGLVAFAYQASKAPPAPGPAPAPSSVSTAPVTAPPAPAAQPQRVAGQVFKDCAECPEMVVIPAGSFMMGSPPNEAERRDSEGPQRRVAVAAFAMGKTEVTQGQWKALMGSNPSGFAQCGDDCPVEKVSWDRAQEYVRRLSAKTGKRYALPSEAQWEYSARAGTRTPFHTGANITTDQANYDGNYPYNGAAKGLYRERTTKVGRFGANAFGLHDMHGNVWEWVQDCYDATAYAGKAPSDGTAYEATPCASRVLRGGSWNYLAGYLRAAGRDAYPPDAGRYDIGFRVCRVPPIE